MQLKTTPKTRPSADKTRRQIIAAATKLFAKQGFAGTSISEIAAAAKVNQSLIYHHFTDKGSLWRFVKTELIKERTDLMEKAMQAVSLADFLKILIEARLEHYEKNPIALKILSWQSLENDQQTLSNFNPAYLASMRSKITAFKKSGEIDASLNTDLIILMIVTSPVQYLLTRDNLGLGAKSRQDYLILIQTLLTKGLKP